MQKYDIKINVPPFSVMKDEISVSGGKEGVQIVAQHIRKIYEEKVILTIMWNMDRNECEITSNCLLLNKLQDFLFVCVCACVEA